MHRHVGSKVSIEDILNLSLQVVEPYAQSDDSREERQPIPLQELHRKAP